MQDWRAVWSRLNSGQHVVLRQPGRFPEPDPHELQLVVVHCEEFELPRGALDEARRCLDGVFGASPYPLVDTAANRLRAGLRRHLLGEARESVDVTRYFEALDRCPAPGEPRLALLLRDIDRADRSSIELLIQLFSGPRQPKLPLLLSFDSAQPHGPAGLLLDKLRRVLAPEAFFWQAPAAAAPSGETLSGALPQNWLSLRPSVRGLLRASATIGERFESETLAQLFEVDELTVLAALQEAIDQGLAIEDRGHGVFRLEPALAKTLCVGTMPSLARAWHEQLARLFGGPPTPQPETTLSTASVEAPTPAKSQTATAAETEIDESRATANDGMAAQEVDRAAAPAAAAVTEVRPVALEDEQQWVGAAPRELVQPVDPRHEDWWRRLEAELLELRGHSAPLREDSRAVSQPRAANHAEAAGLWEAATEQHLAAAERAALAGAHPQALEYATRALAAAERIRDRERSRRTRAHALLLIGRSRWQSRGPSETFSLSAALEPLAQCRTLLTESDPAELRAELGLALANVQYDLGTPEALLQALKELTLASQLLLDAGQPLEAARLLNDEAAICVKLGDPVRANYLLTRSRDVFSRVAGSYPQARLELAETEHLLAHLLFHVVARPGRERDALQLGIQHALVAEEVYLDEHPRELGRVWEILGRLELRLGNLDAASRRLEDARQLQQQLGDSIGLARSTAALA